MSFFASADSVVHSNLPAFAKASAWLVPHAVATSASDVDKTKYANSFLFIESASVKKSKK